MLTIVRRLFGFETDAGSASRPAETERLADAEAEREIVPGPPIASSGAMLRQAKKSETEAALERAAGKTG